MSSLLDLPVTPPASSANVTSLRAYSDPVIFRDDRVLKTLLRKEAKYLPSCFNYFRNVQSEIKPHMRKEVADWMLEICEDQQAQPEVFCLAMNYLDRFLSVCSIGRPQLQLLGAVCLLVSWKVREHEPLPAMRLAEYSDFNINLVDIMEWEVLLLSKLDWDMSAVIASDFIEHIILRIRKHSPNLSSLWSPDVIRSHAETLITMCSAHYAFSSLAPSLVASACVITTLRPILESSSQSTQKSSSPNLSSQKSSSPNLSPNEFNTVLDIVEKITLLDRGCIVECMDRIETMMRASLPPSPTSSPALEEENRSKTSVLPPGEQSANTDSSEQFLSPERRPVVSADEDDTTTPTKVLDVASKCSKL